MGDVCAPCEGAVRGLCVMSRARARGARQAIGGLGLTAVSCRSALQWQSHARTRAIFAPVCMEHAFRRALWILCVCRVIYTQRPFALAKKRYDVIPPTRPDSTQMGHISLVCGLGTSTMRSFGLGHARTRLCSPPARGVWGLCASCREA